MNSETPHVFMRTLYVRKQGCHLLKKRECLVVRWKQQTLLEVPVTNLDQICLLGNIQTSAAVIRYCLSRNIPVHFLSWAGTHQGVLRRSAESHWKVHRLQIHLYEDNKARLAFAKQIVHNKIGNGTAFLSQHLRNHPETKRLKSVIHYLKHLDFKVSFAKSVSEVMGMEGFAARNYFEGFGRCIRSENFTFPGRTRRPATDPINSLLNFGYSLLTQRIDGTMTIHGIDSTIGLMHESRGYPALACDLVEEFRAPIVDALVLRIINQGILKPNDFYIGGQRSKPCLLCDESQKKFLQAFEQKLDDSRLHPDASGPVDWRRIIDLQVRQFKRYVLGKQEMYIPLEIR